MRTIILRAAVIGGLLAATAAVAQQPGGRVSPEQAKKIKDGIDELLKERDKLGQEVKDASSAAALRKELIDKLQLLPGRLGPLRPPEVLPPPQPVPPVTKPVKPTEPPKADPGEFVPLDPLRAAQNYFQGGDIDAAYRTVRIVMAKPETLSPDDRAFAYYLTASCLRRQGKLTEAALLYREIADEKPDKFLTESALTQLAAIRTVQELERQLEELRAKRKAK